MSRRLYPPEVHAFPREFIPGHTNQEVSQEASDRLGFDMTAEQVKSYKKNRHIQSGLPRGFQREHQVSKIFTPEMVDFIMQHHEGVGPKEMTDIINSEFGTAYTRSQIKAFYGNHHICSGLTGRFKPGSTPYNKGWKQADYMSQEAIEKTEATRFKAGHLPHNYRPVGTVVHNTAGYLVRKIADPDQWEFVHRAVWEEHHGPIPEGMLVSFKDGDKDNCSIENLMLISRSDNLEMWRSQLRCSEPELTEVGLQVARLKIATYDAKRKNAPKHKKRQKPVCYEAYGRNCCLGKITRAGTVAARCQRCKWLEKEETP